MKCDNLRPQRGAWGKMIAALVIVLLLAGCGEAGGAETTIAPDAAMHRADAARTGVFHTEGLAEYLSLIHISEPTRPY